VAALRDADVARVVTANASTIGKTAVLADRQIEQFLYREARLMDEGRYDEWLSLWADDGVYWVPCNHESSDPAREVSIIYDDRRRLGERIDRLNSGSVLAQEPKPRMRRVLSNIEIVARGEGEAAVHSNFVLGIARGATQQLWIGRNVHRLRARGDRIEIAHKTVLLINSEQEMPLLQHLI
jgi:3-phenylpropionate/cinnamic acid dioxygenase small subunit